MVYRFRFDLCLVFLSILLFAGCYLHLYSNGTDSGDYLRPGRLRVRPRSNEMLGAQFAVREELVIRPNGHVSFLEDWITPAITDSVLFPDWEVIVFVPPEADASTDSGEEYECVFQSNQTSPATPAWVSPLRMIRTFRCVLPKRTRRMRPFFQPALTRVAEAGVPVPGERKLIHHRYAFTREIFRWTYLVYEALSTENDVVLFAKGVNHRQGINRPASQLKCVFGEDAATAYRTAVTISNQEVFRCGHPDTTALPHGEIVKGRIKVSLEITNTTEEDQEQKQKKVVPSVAYYTPRMRKVAAAETKSQLCASTMIYNAAKFLKEWVTYHSRIGVEKFILYDNDSNDELQRTVEELNGEGFNVETVVWPWPKTQEAGFSHSAIQGKDTCKWMMYVDVDEFVYSPKWLNASGPPSGEMLPSLLPKKAAGSNIGQVMISCNEFGPSNRSSHPAEGVTQGYTCRRRAEQRHKSMVLLEAVDASLVNAVHHFGLKKGFRGKKVGMSQGVVNHYKYQAWSEFKAKFRRRVSAYVVDWRDEVNPASKDRAPGLGFLPIEPKGWSTKFCEVNDQRLKTLTRRWFAIPSTSSTSQHYKMTWERR